MAFFLAYCGRVIIHHVFVPHLLYFLRTSLFAGVFSHSEGCLSLSFRVSFAVQMLLRLIQSCLLSFGLAYFTYLFSPNELIFFKNLS